MVKIGLMSDTHGFVDPKVYEYFKNVDEIWHAGDVGDLEVIDSLRKFKPLVGVFGNIDNHEIRTEFNEFECFTREGIKVLMTHIGGKPGRFSLRARERIIAEKPNLFVCGHSHILFVKNDQTNKMLCMNPGACGNHGFHNVKTLLRFSINEDQIENLEVIEIGNR